MRAYSGLSHGDVHAAPRAGFGILDSRTKRLEFDMRAKTPRAPGSGGELFGVWNLALLRRHPSI